mmetsp:Transcript_2824/g.5278  ORF Transcript_2824/g.5278 Transcript_2824/m.5278 type:complete len:217 (+) Transcript_2824:178-828(+)
MSMCAKGFFLSTKFSKNKAAVIAPPKRVPIFLISAIKLFNCSLYSASRGILQLLSQVLFDASAISFARSSLDVQTPQTFFPSETMQAPVKVDNSIIDSHPTSLSAYTKASASVRRPSASVLRTSIVFPLDAVKISLGTYALSLIIFSHAATMKWASTPSGSNAPTALAAPKTAAAPPQSNFINSIMAVLMLYPPVSNNNPFPTTPTFFFTFPLLGE